MGGSAFTSRSDGKPLHTPRMPRAIYEQVKAQCHRILRDHYICVASPIDGPAKSDFGDVDILVAWPRRDADNQDQNQIQTIAQLLGATDVITRGSDCECNLAIPWPEELRRNDHDSAGQQELSQQRHIQVDVHICQTRQALEWMLLKHAHGDIWSILGSVIRPYGLTIDEKALWIRIPELELLNKRKSKVFLTCNPSEVLCFLGLPIHNAWEAPFASLRDMYEYVAQCPMFWAGPDMKEGDLNNNNNNNNNDDNNEHASPANKQTTTAAPLDLQTPLKGDERRRLKSRPAFNRWMNDFVPECRRQGRYLQKRTSRHQVTNAALSRFHVSHEYHSRRKEALLKAQEDVIFKDLIKGMVPHPATVPLPHVGLSDADAYLFRACQVKALKKVIIEGNETYGVLQPHVGLKNAEGLFDLDRVVEFIARHKQEVGEKALLVHYKRCEEVMAAKAALRK
ncbi:hypothetical protein E4U15_001380 [Claviceps sp. LM218 group G6]|nr:hypothetical protein E4U15_001380 [Claviceps sp. LM218 group G6]